MKSRIEAGEGVQVIAFLLRGESFAVDIVAVEEVISPERLHPVPGVGRPLLGVLLVRGDTVPVLDLAAALELGGAPGRGGDVLVLEHGGRSIGVATDGVLGTRFLPADSVLPPPPDAPSALLGLARTEDGVVALLDPFPLLSRPNSLPPMETP